MKSIPRPLKRFEGPQERRHRAGESVKFPDRHYIETAPMRVGNEPVKRQPGFLVTVSAIINVNPRNLLGATPAVLFELSGLHCRVLTVISG
jgi:hypothetical protein